MAPDGSASQEDREIAAMSTPGNPALEALIQSAREMAKAGRPADAEALWRRVLEQVPGHPEAVLALGMASITRWKPLRSTSAPTVTSTGVPCAAIISGLPG